MAKQKDDKKGATKSRDARVADIEIAATTLAKAKDFTLGYGTIMQQHINSGKKGK